MFGHVSQRWVQKIKNIYHFAQAHFWRAYFHFPDKVLRIYGITGTNGKTTTSILLGSILRQAHGHEKVGLLTTITFWIGAREEINETKMTTMPSRDVFRYLRRMQDAGATHAVLEVTSHALDQHRLAGIKLDGAIILNIAREHLDYHRTMDEYAKAKAKIIGYLKPNTPLIGKGDDRLVKKILRQAQSSKLKAQSFTAQEAQQVVSSLQGNINKENALAATLLARAIGIDNKTIERGIAAVDHVPGRNEWTPFIPLSLNRERDGVRVKENATPHPDPLPLRGEGNKAYVVIDYAVTPDALSRLYDEVRAKTEGRIIGILGAAGMRDRGKRPLMSAAVAKRADQLILTREDPWTESEEQIFADLAAGLKDTRTPWQKIIDRRAAIRYALEAAQPGDVIVLTGKGAETGMAVGKEIKPWNDRNVVEELLREQQRGK